MTGVAWLTQLLDGEIKEVAQIVANLVEGHGGGEDQGILTRSMTTIYKTKFPTIT
jgi:hypothetical protein